MEAKNRCFHHAMQGQASGSVFRARRQEMLLQKSFDVLSLAKKFVLGVVDNSPRLRTMAESVWLAARDSEDSDEKYAGAFCDSLFSDDREKLRRFFSLRCTRIFVFPPLKLRARRWFNLFS